MALRRWLARARSDATRRLTANAWPILQAALAATAAWVLASRVLDHPDGFFAPIAAVVALNTARGDRGSNAIRLVLGVIVGILVGEAAIALNGRGFGSLGGATLGAMICALAISGERLVIAQGAAGAILTVTTPFADAGAERLYDAAIGAGVALVVSQLLFPAEPLGLLRRAEGAAALRLAEGLALTAAALRDGDRSLAVEARDLLRRMPGPLVELANARRRSERTVRWSPVRRHHERPVVQEEENAAQLDLLAGSCLMLARAVQALDGPAPRELAAAVGDVAAAINGVAGALGDREARQRAADRALAAGRTAVEAGDASHAELSIAWIALRVTARDVMVFVGIDKAEAQRALAERGDPLRIPSPAASPRMPFRSGWRP